MDAVEFLKEAKRYCKWCKNTTQDGKKRLCDACYFEKLNNIFNLHSMAYCKFVEIVEQWSKEHPIKTRQSEFLKQWPDAKISDDGLPAIAPCQLNVLFIHGKAQKDCEGRGVCNKCRRDFWLKEIE